MHRGRHNFPGTKYRIRVEGNSLEKEWLITMCSLVSNIHNNWEMGTLALLGHVGKGLLGRILKVCSTVHPFGLSFMFKCIQIHHRSFYLTFQFLGSSFLFNSEMTGLDPQEFPFGT